MDAYLTGLAIERDGQPPLGSAPEDDGGYRPLPLVLGSYAEGRGDDYRPAPWAPKMGQLDYVQKFTTVTLILVAIVALTIFGVINPRRAARAVASTAKRRAGLE